MARRASGTAILWLAGLAAGVSGGWVAGRASLPAPAPPDVFVNPLAEVRRGETLTLAMTDGTREVFTVKEVADDSVLLLQTRESPGIPATVREFRAARTYAGFFFVLEGDVDRDAALAAARNFVVTRMAPVDLRLGILDRTVRCWRIDGVVRGGEERSFWISAEFPVHGLLRADGPKGRLWEIEGAGDGQ
ncbi:MAG: hypothetical protein L6R43_19160 [Planctomycetes bacterium]|nr:hypothetical protein [Planctomycetota bacterium]